MLVKDYLKNYASNTDVTFIKAIAQKEENSRFYDEVYQTTPIRQLDEWKNSSIMNYHILNNKQHPIIWLSGANWENKFKRGDLISLLVISQEDMLKLYSEKQAADLIEFIEKEIKSK